MKTSITYDKFVEEIAKWMGKSEDYIHGILSVCNCVAICKDGYHGLGEYISRVTEDGLIELNYYRGGSWFTKLAISSKEYRQSKSTKASCNYLLAKDNFGTDHIAFLFTDDYSNLTVVVRKFIFVNKDSKENSVVLRLIEEIDNVKKR